MKLYLCRKKNYFFMKTIEQIQKELKKYEKTKMVDGNEVVYYTAGAEKCKEAIKFLTYNNEHGKYDDAWLKKELEMLEQKREVLSERCKSMELTSHNGVKTIKHGLEEQYRDVCEKLRDVNRQRRFLKYLM